MFIRSHFLSPEAAPAAAAPATAPPTEKVNTMVNRLLQQFGSAEAALSSLSTQLITHQTKAEEDLRTIGELRAQIPDATKMVVLPKEKAELLGKFEALKLTPEQVTEGLKEMDTLKGTVHTYGIEKLSREGAPNIGFDPEATVDLIAGKQLHVELREVDVEVEKNGKKEKVKKKVPFVRPAADEKAQLQPLSEYAKTLPAFEQRALAATAQPPVNQPATGQEWPGQTPATTGSENPAASIMQQVRQRYPLPSELRKQSQQPVTQGA